MSVADLEALPSLGVGLGFRPPFGSALHADSSAADFLEITVEHYLDAPREKQRELEALRERYTLIPHGLNLSLGSAEGLDQAYLERLAAFIARLAPPWWSEHICFTRAGGVDIGHLSPLPFSNEALDILCANLAEVRRLIPQPLILENITYLLSLGGELSEAEFLAGLHARTGCGLLLDITNLYINSVNHSYDLDTFLQTLPPRAVVQLHFVGEQRRDGLLLDSHARATSEPIWQVMDKVLARFEVKGAILERDEQLPPFAELKAELTRARALGHKHERW